MDSTQNRNEESRQLALAVENRLNELGFSVNKIEDGMLFGIYPHFEVGVGSPRMHLQYVSSNRLLSGTLVNDMFTQDAFVSIQIRSVEDVNFLIQHSALIKVLFSELFAGISGLPSRLAPEWRQFLGLD